MQIIKGTIKSFIALQKQFKQHKDIVRHLSMPLICVAHICHLGWSVSGYADQSFIPQLNQYVVLLSKSLNLHCYS